MLNVVIHIHEAKTRMHPKLMTKEVKRLEKKVMKKMKKAPPKSFQFGPLETLHWAAVSLKKKELALLRDIERECGWEISNEWWIKLLQEADSERDLLANSKAMA